MAMTLATQQRCAAWVCARLFGDSNTTAHFNLADALAAVQAIDSAYDATLNQAVVAVGGATTVAAGLIAQLPAPFSTGTAAEKAIVFASIAMGRGGLI